MKLAVYSDLHLEFGVGFHLPSDLDADVLILAGDIIKFDDLKPLAFFLKNWHKPVVFVAGNHEFYTKSPMKNRELDFLNWCKTEKPNVHFLRDEALSLDGVHFFGGTMWTDFNGASISAMEYARMNMNDFRYIKTSDSTCLLPIDTIEMHAVFVKKLLQWLQQDLTGPRVVISHHAPVTNPKTQYLNSRLSPAFNSLDMQNIIEEYKPHLWIYGHTHECDNQVFLSTKIFSNQLGYPKGGGEFECVGFNPYGGFIEV